MKDSVLSEWIYFKCVIYMGYLGFKKRILFDFKNKG